MPAANEYTDEFPMGVLIKMFGNLALELEAEEFFIVPQLPGQGHHANVGIVFECGLKRDDILEIVLGMGTGVCRQKPFVPPCFGLLYFILRPCI